MVENIENGQRAIPQISVHNFITKYVCALIRIYTYKTYFRKKDRHMEGRRDNSSQVCQRLSKQKGNLLLICLG